MMESLSNENWTKQLSLQYAKYDRISILAVHKSYDLNVVRA